MKLAELNENQSVEVTYKVWGCFHRDRILAVFSGDDLRHPLIIDAESPDLQVRVEISQHDLANLDRMFEYWRLSQNERSACDTSDCEVCVSWRDEDGVLDMEEFAHAYPPSNLKIEYARFFIGTLKYTILKRVREIAEEKRNAFCDWALHNHPLREIRFLDDSTVCALLDPDRLFGLDARRLAKTLSRACSEQTESKMVTCQVYDAKKRKKRLVSTTFKVRDWNLSQRIYELPVYAFWGMVFSIILVIWLAAWLLWWPIRLVRRLAWGSRKVA